MTSLPEQIQSEESQTSLSDTLLEVWQRRRWLAVDCLMVPLAAAVAVAVFLPNIYRSTALVEIEHVSQPGTQESDANTSMEGQLQRLNEENLSRSHLQQLITRYDLYPAMRKKGAIEGAIDQMRNDVTVSIKDQEHVWGRSTVAFQVAYRSGNPERAAKVANALANFYVEKSQEQGQAEAKSAVAQLEQQLAELKGRLDAQQKAVNDFLSAHLQELPDQVRNNQAQIERLYAELASLNRSGRSRVVTQTSSGPVVVSAGEAQDPELTRLNDQLNELRGRVTDEYPDVVHLKAQIAARQAALRRTELARPATPSTSPAQQPSTTVVREEPASDSRSIEGQRARIRAQIASIEQASYNAPKREMELQELTAPLNATRASYAALQEKLDVAKQGGLASEQRELDPFRILDPAVASSAPAGPGRVKLAGIGIALSILFALLAVFLVEKLDTSFHSLDELRAFTRVPILASVPNIIAPHDMRIARRRARITAVLVAVASIGGVAAAYALAHNNESLVLMLSRGHA